MAESRAWRRTVESVVSSVVLASIVLGALWLMFVFDEWEFLSFVFGTDQPILGPILGLLVYGASAFIIGAEVSSDGASVMDVLALIFSTVIALVCFTSLLGRMIRLAIGLVW
jgi:hypothetical protein